MVDITATVGRPPIEVQFGENTAEAMRQAELAASYAENLGEAQIIAIRRETLANTTLEAESQSRAAADAELTARLAIAAYGGRIIYSKSNASGANNGTSWADAYTSFATAVLSASSGDRVYSNAPESAPYPATAISTTALTAETNNAGYAIGATVITLAATGSGAIAAGEVVQFDGDTARYVVTSGDTNVANGGSITIAAPGLLKAIPASQTAITKCTIADYIEIVGDQGPDGATWISALIKPGNFTDEGGGVFKATGTGSAVAAAYGLVRDDLAGTVSGLDLTTAANVADLAAQGVQAADCVAWLGCLKKAASTTATPAEGEFSYFGGGVLYINPPGSPTLAQVNAGAGYCINTDCLSFTKTGGVQRGLVLRNITTFYSPAETTGFGYGVKHNGCRDSVFSGIKSILNGDHAVVTTINSGMNNVMRNCLAVQLGGLTAGAANPFTFYTSAADYPNVGHIADRLTFIAIPLLTSAGAPVRTVYSPTLGLSHTDTIKVQGGVKWSNCLQIDGISEIVAKSGVAMTGNAGFIASQNSGGTFTDDDGGFPNKVYGGKARGLRASPNHDIEYRGTEFDREGYGSNSLILLSLNSFLARYRMIGCTLKTGAIRRWFAQMEATDLIIMEGCRIVLQATDNTNNPSFIHSTHTTADRVRLRSNVIDGVASNALHFLQGSGSLGLSWANAAGAITSDGANILGTNLVQVIGSETSEAGAYVPKDQAWWVANVTGATSDLIGALNPSGLL